MSTRPWLYTCATVQTAVVARHIHASGTLHPDHLAYELAEAYVADPDRHYGSNTRRFSSVFTTESPGAPSHRAPLRVSARWASAQHSGPFPSATTTPATCPEPWMRRGCPQWSRMPTPTRSRERRRSHWWLRLWPPGRPTCMSSGTPCCLSSSQASPASESSTRLSSPQGTPPEQAAELLGNGRWKCAHDTVPFAIWCALNHHRDYRAAMWCAADGAGRLHTTCALVSALLCAGRHTPPAQWLERTERLPSRLTLPRRVGTPVSPYRRTRA